MTTKKNYSKKRLLNIFLIFILIISIVMPSSVFAYNNKDIKQSDKTVSNIIKYFSFDNNEYPIYDRDQALADKISNSDLEVADMTYDILCTYYNYENNTRQSITTLASIPIYGNWCGPGYGSGTPIDILDNGCRSHDKCYGSRGYHKCSCDNDFLKYINLNINKMSGKQKSTANAIKTWLKIKTSNVTQKGGNTSCRK